MKDRVSMDTMDLSEIRKLVGNDTLDMNFSVDDILKESITGVKSTSYEEPTFTEPVQVSTTKVVPEPIHGEETVDAPPQRRKATAEDIDKTIEQLIQREMKKEGSVKADRRSERRSERSERAERTERTETVEREKTPIHQRILKTVEREEKPVKKLHIDTGRLFNSARDEIGDISKLDQYNTESVDFRMDYDYDTIEEEISPQEMARKCSKNMSSLNKRIILMTFFVFATIYVNIASSLTLPLPSQITYTQNPFMFLLTLAALQVVSMLCTLDILADGIVRLVKLRPNLNSLVTLGLIASLAHITTIILKPEYGGWLPYTCVNVLALYLCAISQSNKNSVLYKSYKTSSFNSRPDAIVNTDELCSKVVLTDIQDFFHKLNSKGIDEKIIEVYSTLAIIFSVAASFYIANKTDNGQSIFWFLSAITTISAPYALIFAVNIPFKNTYKRLTGDGVAYAGFSGVENLAKAGGVILTDGDIFPTGSMEIIGLKVLNDYSSETVIAYTGALFEGGKSATAKVFIKLLNERYGRTVKADDIVHYENGGFGGNILGDKVLVGSASFIMRMGVKIAEGRNVKNAVFVAINGELAGIFAIKYSATSQTYMALNAFEQLKMSIVLAIRDFNIGPTLVENTFDLRRGSTVYPEVEKRIEFSEELSENGELSTILSRESVASYSNAVSCAKKLYSCVMSNLLIGTISGVLGLLLMAYLCYTFSTIAASPVNMLIYLMLWFLPVLLYSSNCKK